MCCRMHVYQEKKGRPPRLDSRIGRVRRPGCAATTAGDHTRPQQRSARPACAARFETRIFIDSTLVDAQIAPGRSAAELHVRPGRVARSDTLSSLGPRIRHQKPAVAWASGQTRPGPFHLRTAKNSGLPKRSGVVCLTSHAHHSAADRCDFSYAAMPPSASLQQQAHLWRLWPLALGSVERLQLPCGDVARSARLPQGRSAWLQKGLGAAGREALHALQMAQHWLEVALRALGLQSQRARPRLQPLRPAALFSAVAAARAAGGAERERLPGRAEVGIATCNGDSPPHRRT